MKPTMRIALLPAFLVLFWWGWALGAEVTQGKCLAYDKTQQRIVLEEYDTNFSAEQPYGSPTGIQSIYDVSGAQIGIPPQTGDILRIAYKDEGERRKALRVMNVSRQDLRRK